MFGTADKSPWGDEFIEYEIAREVFREREWDDDDWDAEDEGVEDE